MSSSTADTFRDAIRAVIAERNDDYDLEGDVWLFRPDPDCAELMVDALTDAVMHVVSRGCPSCRGGEQ